jgi:hypothetical protein
MTPAFTLVVRKPDQMQEDDSLRRELLAQVASVAPILVDRAGESENLGAYTTSPGMLSIRARLASYVHASWVEAKLIPSLSSK